MKKLLRVIVPVLILILGLAGAMVIVANAPKVNRKKPVIVAPTVETVVLERVDYQTKITANGTVIPSRQVSLKSQVSGNIVWQNEKLVPGKSFRTGEKILKIDQRDYEFSVTQREEAVANAEYQLKLEAEQGEIAKEEWELLGDSISSTEEGKSLALREPQMKKALASLESAKSSLDKAKLDLERTVITAPFNSIVRKENSEKGQFVSANIELATLVGTDYFWIQIALPYDKLAYLEIPESSSEKGSSVEILLQAGAVDSKRQGTVVQLLSDLEEMGRLARVIVKVDDPLLLNSRQADEAEYPLLLGSYVTVNIDSEMLEDVFPIPLKAMRDSDEIAAGTSADKGRVWILTEDNLLEERDIELVWQNDQYAFACSGLNEGEKLIVSNVSSPLKGMKLRDIKDETKARKPGVAPDSRRD